MNIKRDDNVLVIAGRDRGKTGKIRQVLGEKERAIVEGVNVVKRHTKPRSVQARQAGIVEKEAPVHISNLALICPKCDKPTRVGHTALPDGRKVRVCKRCGEQIG